MKKQIVMLFLIPVLTIAQLNAKSGIAKTNTISFSSSLSSPKKTGALNKYSGHYKSELIDNYQIDLIVNGEKLYAFDKVEGGKEELIAVSPTKFITKSGRIKVEFMEEEGKVLYMMVAKKGMTWLIKEN